MITLFTGSPGAGKTAFLVDYLSKISDGRPIYSDGLDGLLIPHFPVDSSDWHNQLPDGAILVIDEVQRVWRPRGPGAKVPESVAELETHRHRGIDIFITTQSPRLVDSNVRALIGRHIHIRDTGILGRYWYEWPECSENMAWKTCINKKRVSLPKKAFQLYKSASLHTVPVRGVPRALFIGIAALLIFTILAFMAYRIFQRNQSPSPDNKKITAESNNSSGNFITADVKKLPIDDRVDFIPRVSHKPESAPAYDHLRKISVMPVVVGGYCQGDHCKCITQQGTDPGLSNDECRTWVYSRPFDHYRIEQAQPVQQPSQPPQSVPVAENPPAGRQS